MLAIKICRSYSKQILMGRYYLRSGGSLPKNNHGSSFFFDRYAWIDALEKVKEVDNWPSFTLYYSNYYRRLFRQFQLQTRCS